LVKTKDKNKRESKVYEQEDSKSEVEDL